MKTFLSLMMGVCLLLSGLSGCDTKSGHVPPKPVKTPAPGRQSTKPAQMPLRTPWPFAAEQDKDIALSDNLTAKNFLLIFDGSGSMVETDCAGGKTKIEVAKMAVKEWSKSVPQDANIGLVAFFNNGWAKLPLSAHNRHKFMQLVDSIKPYGQTPLGAAVEQAYHMLTEQGRHQLGYGEYILVVVTDGKATDPDRLNTWTKTILSGTPIVIHTIGFCIGENHSLNQRGRTIYRTADNPAELRRGLQEVLAEAETFDVTDFKQ